MTGGRRSWSRRGVPLALVLAAGCALASCASIVGIEDPKTTCENGDLDGDETAADCGGSCGPCSDCTACQGNADCASGRCLAGICRPAAGGALGFAATQFPFNTNPLGVSVMDSGDGNVQLVVANRGTADVSLFDIGSNVSLASWSNLNVGDTPSHVVVADFNDDGDLDIAVNNPGTQRVGVLLGDSSDSSFDAPQTVQISATAVVLSSGDFNGDQKADLVTGNADGSVTVLLSNGDSTFTVRPAASVATDLVALAVADFDDNGQMDVAVVSASDAELSVLLGDGAGGLGSPTKLPTGAQPSGVAAGDFNGDGKRDLVVANSGDDDVLLLFGDGSGTAFATTANIAAGSTPSWVTSGDFNGDSTSDLAVANGSGGVSVLMATGGGSFAAAVPYQAGSASSFVAASDLNGDAIAELIVTNGADNTVTVLEGVSNGTFGTPRSYGPGKGLVELRHVAGTQNDFTVVSAETKSVLTVDGSSSGLSIQSFSSVPVIETPVSAVSISSSTLVANATSDSFTVFVDDGSGGTSKYATYGAGRAPRNITLTNGNSEDVNDPIVVNEDSNDVYIRIHAGDDRDYGDPLVIPVGSGPVAAISAQLKASGLRDVLVANAAGNSITVLVWLDNSPTYAPQEYPVGGAPVAIAVADLNGDTLPDVAVANSGSDDVSILLGTGGGALVTTQGFAAGPQPMGIAADDFNLDGRADLAVVNESAGTVSVMLGNGDGSFQAPVSFAVGAGPVSITSVDFDDNCRPDLMVGNAQDNSATLLLNTPN